MSSEPTPVGDLVLVGRSAYQIYSEVWEGRVRFSARIGKHFMKKDTGEPRIIAKMEADSTADFLRAAEAAGHQLEQIRNAAFQNKVEQQKAAANKAAVSRNVTTEQQPKAQA